MATTWHFYALDRPNVAGVGRETAHGSDLADQVEVFKRRYQESLSQLASLTGRLRELATIDSLTGVLNRKAFLDAADSEWVRHRRHRHSLSCAMLDVDAFKKVNDSFGHAAGDAMLQHIIKGMANNGSRKWSRITPETAEKAKPENPDTTPPRKIAIMSIRGVNSLIIQHEILRTPKSRPIPATLPG